MHAHQSQALKNIRDLNVDSDIRTQELVNAIQTIRLSIAGSNVAFERKKEPVRANRWAARMSEIRAICGKLATEEEVRLHECTALASWESR